jgi:hypothetical protein
MPGHQRATDGPGMDRISKRKYCVNNVLREYGRRDDALVIRDHANVIF